MTFSVLSRTLFALVALASVVTAAPGGGARRSFANKDGVLDTATRVSVRVTPSDVVENEPCSSRLDSHSWSKNHLAFLPESDFANSAACGALIKIGTPGHEQLAVVGGTCADCKTGSLAVSESLFKTFADLASGQFTAAWTFVGDVPESLEAPTTGTLAQDQAIKTTVERRGTTAPVSEDISATSVAALFKRFDNARMTYYDVGLGACGWTNQPSDFVVAINTAQYDSGRHCGQRVQIRAYGKTAIAEVVDECPGCEGHGLDLSEPLFAHFAPMDKGVFMASWDFVTAHPTKRDASPDAAASKLAQPTPSYAAAALTFPAAGLSKRFDHAKMTFYDVGLGACGHTNQPSDFVVALNAAQYDSGHHCGQRIQIRANGKTAVAQVVDRCTDCEGHGLDLSKGLFSHFADTSDGVFIASWDFISDHHYQREVITSDASLARRYDGVPMTRYEVGLGACGWTNKASDFVVALNEAMYGAGGYCGRRITISANGKTAVAQVVDECPGCEGQGLDLSNSLFEHFAPYSQGEFVGSWDFIDDHNHGHKHQRDISVDTDASATLAKRSDGAHMTHYKVGLGACGWTNQPSDFVVALNSARYGSGEHCGQRIQIRANGKTATAQVVDECPGCEGDGLDLSDALFEHFAPSATGEFIGSWDFIGGHAHHARNSSAEPSSAITESSTPLTSFTFTATSGPSPAATPSSPLPLVPRSSHPGANHGPLTWYKDGLGACGWTNQPSDYVVALNSAQYGSGQYCGRRIEITAEGKKAIAEIVDECPGCDAGGLDLSHGLFQHFAPDTKGVLSGSWRFVS